jgi:DNA-binding MarR family transcriptional regulator
MNISAHRDSPLDAQQMYRKNFARHILSVTLYMQSEVMNALTLKHGHSELRINYEPYISAAAKRGVRLSDIARMLGISRQAANQKANQIEAAGYLQRAADPSDGRAKLLVTTPRAKAMIRQGGVEAMKVQSQLADIVGEKELANVNASVIELCQSLSLLFPHEEENSLILPGIMPRLSDYITNRLLALNAAKGHPQLKRGFGTVLTSIGPRGGRIQQMANRHDVSKQAISAIASELEDLGYIRRDPDPEDTRQVVLQFTGSGKKLIANSVASVDQLAAEFSVIIGEPALAQTVEAMARIYRSLQLEEDIFGHADNNDIHTMARQITRQLGEEGAKALARLLLSDESEY